MGPPSSEITQLAVGKTKRILSAGRNILQSAFQLVWTDTCSACGSDVEVHNGFCSGCNAALLEITAKPYCPRCGATIAPGVNFDESGCPACPTIAARFKSIIRVSTYDRPIRRAILEMKYHRKIHIAKHLAALLAEAIAARAELEGFDVVMAIPMYWARRLFRRWDHCLELAREVSNRLNLPMGNELRRIRNTPPQARLPASRRADNVRGAFAAKRTATLEGANVLLIDDVLTTGATANEASRTLLSAGVNSITVAVIAKADPPPAYSDKLRY